MRDTSKSVTLDVIFTVIPARIRQKRNTGAICRKRLPVGRRDLQAPITGSGSDYGELVNGNNETWSYIYSTQKATADVRWNINRTSANCRGYMTITQRGVNERSGVADSVRKLVDL